MTGLLDASAYVPSYVLPLGAIAEALGAGGGRGERSVAGFDEDSTTMGVAAARALDPELLHGAEVLWFATTAPAYLDKTNAAAIHAAVRLPDSTGAYDAGASLRSAFGALRAAAAGRGAAVFADIWTGRPGSDDERLGGDAAAALLFGDDDGAIAVVETASTHTAELLERWRLPGERAASSWDDRFAAEALVGELLAATSSTAAAEFVIVSAANRRSGDVAARGVEGVVVGAVDGVGFGGAADVALKLVLALEQAQPGDRIAVVQIAEGLEMLVLRATERIAEWQARHPRLAGRLGARHVVRYADMLTWRGYLERQPPRRPDPQAPAAPPALRSTAWKFALTGSRCVSCGAVHAPPERVCRGCGGRDGMAPHDLAGPGGTVANLTVDHLAFSPAPPTVLAIVDLGGGARAPFEVADAQAAPVGLGDRVEMVFRRLYTADGVHDYFWKARRADAPAVGTSTTGGPA